MGGHKAGNVASKLTVEDLGKLWSETFFEGTPEATLEIWLKIKFVMKMKILLALENFDEYQGMGTTLEALVIKAGMLISAHVGDSRTYLMRDGELNKNNHRPFFSSRACRCRTNYRRGS